MAPSVEVSSPSVKEKPEDDRSGSLSSLEQGWNIHDEARARRKIDFSVLPLLFLGLLVFQLDRMNIASALTGGFAKDINVDLNTINLGNQLMFMGIVLLEIPSNMALQWIGPRTWIAGQVLVFGTVAALQVFVRNRAGFLAARVMLGFCESGYIPGAIYTLSTWYTKSELAKRVAILFFGMFGANAISPVLATGILKMDHLRGLRGWQWLFLCIIRFDDADRDVLQKRLEQSSNESAEERGIPLRLVLRMGPIAANALAAVGAFLSLLVVFVFAYLSDRTNRRGATVIAAQLCFLVALVVAREVHPHVGQWSRWGLWTTVNAFAVGYHPVHNTWVQLNCRDPRERSIAIAMWVMSAISGLMVGTQYYRAGDGPFYRHGLLIQICMVVVGIVFAALQIVIYVVHNRRVAQGKHKADRDGRPAQIYVP
ncbi:hypothetical protein NEMBOFW57_008601 [Staphylotrichum longicolle]|uniref:Uncharacterized protein n=1 Tax=Staphylotrichum longicolle TaxID=669026 RepID=A0AAD4HZ27_9PEZI|nr:hypothetical protein NEMBOFW57_008601 [Staphylotrichum longicolle]